MKALCECWFLDVGQGLANVILLGGGRAIVIDSGPATSSQAIDLLKRYVDKIEVLLISHNDSDHDGSVPILLENYRKAINKIVFLHDRPYDEIKVIGVLKRLAGDFPEPERLETNGSEPKVIYRDEIVELSVVSPTMGLNELERSKKYPRANATSGIVLLKCGDSRIYFSGDALLNSWEKIVRHQNLKNPLNCDIMTIPHHGGMVNGDRIQSKDQLYRLYHDIIRPRYGIISVGTSNTHKHPSSLVVKSLREHGVCILCTQMTKQCCDDLESTRAVFDPVYSYYRSKRTEDLTSNYHSRNVACYGTVVASITTKGVELSNRQIQSVSRYVSSIPKFHPICCS